MTDPKSLKIPCSIGEVDIGKTLCDLGANINLLPPMSVQETGIKSRPTTVLLQLADWFVVHPEGKIKDVLVKVDHSILPTYFIILDYEADEDVPIILGRPFLSTGRMLIDVHKEEITMWVNGQEVILNVFKVMEYPDEQEECQSLQAEDEFNNEELEEEKEANVEYLDEQ